MNKAKFLELYIDAPNKVRMLFNVTPFLLNNSIQISQETIPLIAALAYYVPKYKKDDEFDKRWIDDQIKDPEVSPLTIGEVLSNPFKWDLGINAQHIPTLEDLNPIPVATDLEHNKSLLLDSNHTLVTIMSQLGASSLSGSDIEIIRITGNNLETIIGDFSIINRC